MSLETLEAFYNATMAALEEAKNDRLSVKCNLKLAKLWLERKEYGRLRQVRPVLHCCLTQLMSSFCRRSKRYMKPAHPVDHLPVPLQMTRPEGLCVSKLDRVTSDNADQPRQSWRSTPSRSRCSAIFARTKS